MRRAVRYACPLVLLAWAIAIAMGAGVAVTVVFMVLLIGAVIAQLVELIDRYSR